MAGFVLLSAASGPRHEPLFEVGGARGPPLAVGLEGGSASACFEAVRNGPLPSTEAYTLDEGVGATVLWSLAQPQDECDEVVGFLNLFLIDGDAERLVSLVPLLLDPGCRGSQGPNATSIGARAALDAPVRFRVEAHISAENLGRYALRPDTEVAWGGEIDGRASLVAHPHNDVEEADLEQPGARVFVVSRLEGDDAVAAGCTSD